MELPKISLRIDSTKNYASLIGLRIKSSLENCYSGKFAAIGYQDTKSGTFQVYINVSNSQQVRELRNQTSHRIRYSEDELKSFILVGDMASGEIQITQLKNVTPAAIWNIIEDVVNLKEKVNPKKAIF